MVLGTSEMDSPASNDLSYKQLMTHSPRRNPAELRASRHRVARAPGVRLGWFSSGWLPSRPASAVGSRAVVVRFAGFLVLLLVRCPQPARVAAAQPRNLCERRELCCWASPMSWNQTKPVAKNITSAEWQNTFENNSDQNYSQFRTEKIILKKSKIILRTVRFLAVVVFAAVLWFC